MTETFDQTHERFMRIIIIVFSVVGALMVLMIIGVIICCCVPVCYLSSQARQRRATLRAGGVIGQPPAYTAGGGYPQGQYGAQPMYNTAHPSQQQFNQPPSGSPLNQAAANAPPAYPTQPAV